jgi:hypothetical protein
MNYNVTMQRVHETIVAVEKQEVLHACACVHAGVCMRIRVYGLANPARNAYAPYCDVISDPSVSTTFFDIISETVRFSERKKKAIEYQMCVFIFSTTFV